MSYSYGRIPYRSTCQEWSDLRWQQVNHLCEHLSGFLEFYETFVRKIQNEKVCEVEEFGTALEVFCRQSVSLIEQSTHLSDENYFHRVNGKPKQTRHRLY